MASVEAEVAGRTVAAMEIEIDATTMVQVADVVVATMVKETSERSNTPLANKTIGTENQSTTKRGAKLTSFAKRWIERLRSKWRMPRR